MAKVCRVDEQFSIEYDVFESITREYSMREYATHVEAAQAMIAIDPQIDPLTLLVRTEANTTTIYAPTGLVDYYTGTARWTRFPLEGGNPTFPPIEADGDEILTGAVVLESSNKQFSNTPRVSEHTPPGINPRDTKNINVTQTGTTTDVRGYDETEAVLSFSIRVRRYKGAADMDYLVFIQPFVGGTNDSVWRNFAAGTTRLMGCSIDNSNDDWDYIEYEFNSKTNRTDVTIETTYGNIVIPMVEGWQFVHTTNVAAKDNNDNVIMTPHTAFVETEAAPVDFGAFLP